MNCPKCGKELVENARFCTSCGYSLEKANVTPPSAGNMNSQPGNGYSQPGMSGAAQPGKGYGQPGMPGAMQPGNGYGQPGMPPGAMQPGNGYGQPGAGQMGNGYGQPGMPMWNGYAQQPVRQPNPVMQKMGKALLDIFRNPVQAYAEMEKSNDAGPAFMVLGIQAILCGLLMMGLVGLTKEYIWGYYELNYAKIFIIGMFGAFGINMMTALWYFLFVGKLSRKQINFINACSVVAIKGVVNVCLILVAMLFCGISPRIGSLFLLCSAVIGWFYMLVETKPEAEYKNSLFFSKILVVTCSIFANSLWIYLLLKVIMG